MFCQYTPEQQLRFKEIEFETSQKMNKCCDVIFAGKEKELNLIEQNNLAIMNCKIQNIRDGIACCRLRSN